MDKGNIVLECAGLPALLVIEVCFGKTDAKQASLKKAAASRRSP
jgi:hypothetical protein